MSSSNPKVSIEDVAQALKAVGAPTEIYQKALARLNDVAADAAADRAPRGSKAKSQYVIVVSDPDNVLDGKPLVGWVLQMEEEAAPQTVLDRIQAAATDFNNSRKGRRTPVKNVAETIENAPRKFWKSNVEGQKTLIKTRTPVYLLPTDGKLAQ